MLPVFCGFPTNQQKSGASVWSARAAEPAAIVATLGGRIKATGVLRTDENVVSTGVSRPMRYYPCTGAYRTKKSSFSPALAQLAAYPKTSDFFFRMINREVAPACPQQERPTRAAIVAIFCVAIQTHFLTDSQQRSDT